MKLDAEAAAGVDCGKIDSEAVVEGGSIGEEVECRKGSENASKLGIN